MLIKLDSPTFLKNPTVFANQPIHERTSGKIPGNKVRQEYLDHMHTELSG